MRVTTARDRTERAAGLKTFVRLLTDEDLDVQRAALLMVNAAVVHPAFSRAKRYARATVTAVPRVVVEKPPRRDVHRRVLSSRPTAAALLLLHGCCTAAARLPLQVHHQPSLIAPHLLPGDDSILPTLFAKVPR